MNYPEWAPKTVVELHKRRTEGDQSARQFKRDPETVIADIRQKYGRDITEANFKVFGGKLYRRVPVGSLPDDAECLRRKFYRRSPVGSLPEDERTVLLEKLITDLNMESVWITLAKRATHEHDSLRFVTACVRGITGWRGDQKQTAGERRAFYQEIHDTAGKLQSLMDEASAFDSYSINALVLDEACEWLAKVLAVFYGSIPAGEVPDARHLDARYCLSGMIPSIDDVLNDIAEQAKQYRDGSSPVKKPNSQNAKIHYFVRLLSDYCRQTYSQPLHEVVAITTSVIFDLPNCDDDYVRKIVKT